MGNKASEDTKTTEPKDTHPFVLVDNRTQITNNGHLLLPHANKGMFHHCDPTTLKRYKKTKPIGPAMMGRNSMYTSIAILGDRVWHIELTSMLHMDILHNDRGQKVPLDPWETCHGIRENKLLDTHCGNLVVYSQTGHGLRLINPETLATVKEYPSADGLLSSDKYTIPYKETDLRGFYEDSPFLRLEMDTFPVSILYTQGAALVDKWLVYTLGRELYIHDMDRFHENHRYPMPQCQVEGGLESTGSASPFLRNDQLFIPCCGVKNSVSEMMVFTPLDVLESRIQSICILFGGLKPLVRIMAEYVGEFHSKWRVSAKAAFYQEQRFWDPPHAPTRSLTLVGDHLWELVHVQPSLAKGSIQLIVIDVETGALVTVHKLDGQYATWCRVLHGIPFVGINEEMDNRHKKYISNVKKDTRLHRK